MPTATIDLPAAALNDRTQLPGSPFGIPSIQWPHGDDVTDALASKAGQIYHDKC